MNKYDIADFQREFIKGSAYKSVFVKDNVAIISDGELLASLSLDTPVDDGVYLDTTTEIKVVNKSIDVSYMPEVAKEITENTLKVGVESLKKVAECMSNEEVKYYLQGVYIDGPRGVIVATDGHRMCRQPCTVPKDVKSILNRKFILSAIKHGVTEIRISKDTSYFRADNLRVSARLVAASYPDYMRIIEGAKRYNESVSFDISKYKDIKKKKPTVLKVDLEGNTGLLDKDNQYIAGSEIPEGAGYNLRYLRGYFDKKVELHISSLKWQTDAAISNDGNFIIMPVRD